MASCNEEHTIVFANESKPDNWETLLKNCDISLNDPPDQTRQFTFPDKWAERLRLRRFDSKAATRNKKKLRNIFYRQLLGV